VIIMLTKAETDACRRHLLSLKSRLKGDLSQLEDEVLRQTGGEASGGLSNVPLHLADLGSDTFEEELALNLLSNQEQMLNEVNDALTRIEQGEFGRCEECQKDISKGRMSALPYTRHCVECARKLQKKPG
jgi:DnaK suppressor protein